MHYIVIIVSFILDSIISNSISLNSLFMPLCTLMSLIIAYPYFRGDVKKFLIIEGEEGKNKNKKKVTSRHFQLTLNEPQKYEKIKNYLKGLSNFKYLISCEEIAPITGHKHIHIYVQYNKKISVSISKPVDKTGNVLTNS